VHERREPHHEVPLETLRYLEALYDAEISYLDSDLARLLDGLAAAGLADDTLVVLVSDHGEEFKEHGGLSHAGRLHEELVRVPLIFWWPGRISAGTVISRPVQTVDVLPTVLDLVAIAPPEGLSGRSRAAEILLSGRAPNEPPDVRLAGDPVLVQIKESRWALTAELDGGRFKYVSRDDAPHRLFDLATDPGERRDLLSERPDVAMRLRALAAEIGVDGAAETAAPDPGIEPVPETIRERLREIGYVEEAEAAR
jgi:arylsulfatase A-like enzyme